MKKSILLLSVLSITAFTMGCGSSSFDSGAQKDLNASESNTASKKQGGADAQVDTNEGGENSQIGTKEQALKLSDDKAIGKCLDAWGEQPFKSSTPVYRKISAAVQVLGMGKGIQDTKKTSTPSLILISASVSVLGQVEYDFLNPNGWYCMKADINVQTKKTINLACGAQLADSKVNVNVLSDAQSTSSVGVHVLSDVKVNDVGQCK